MHVPSIILQEPNQTYLKMNSSRSPKRIAAALLGLTLAVSASAQDADTTIFKIKAFAEHHGDVSIRNSDAEFDQLRYGADMILHSYFDRGSSLGISAGYSRSEYDRNDEALPAGALGHDGIEEFKIRARATWMFADELGLTGLAGINFAKANGTAGTSLTDDPIARLGLGVTYIVNDDLTVTLGAIWAERVARGSFYLPLILIDWTITENLSLRTSDGIYLYYDILADGTQVADFGGSYYRQEYATSSNQGAVEEGWQLEAGYTWTPGEQWFLRPYVGWNSSRSFRVFQNDTQQSGIRYGSGFYLGLGVGGNF